MHKYKSSFSWLCLSILCLCIYLLNTTDPNFIDYNRQLITHGQYWRLISGNFNHTNEYHLILNITALLVIAGLHAQYYSSTHFSFIILYLASAVGIAIFILSPEVSLYVGLSGILHGLMVIGGACDIRNSMKTGWLLVLGTIGKVVYEQVFNNTEQMNKLIEAQVLTEAHLYGLVAGLIIIPLILHLTKDNMERS